MPWTVANETDGTEIAVYWDIDTHVNANVTPFHAYRQQNTLLEHNAYATLGNTEYCCQLEPLWTATVGLSATSQDFPVPPVIPGRLTSHVVAEIMLIIYITINASMTLLWWHRIYNVLPPLVF